ncbi:MAG TPA: dihydrofolate reductase family protein, partial [Gemmatimonadales bacterium]|nr:dihydrofolate reductase family protein [Gemmatimonadales bacterium]
MRSRRREGANTGYQRTNPAVSASRPFLPFRRSPLSPESSRQFEKAGLATAIRQRQGSQRVADIDALAALKREDGPNLLIQGSTTLYPQLLAHGLLDRIVTMTAPVVLG